MIRFVALCLLSIAAVADPLPATTAIDDYVNAPDEAYRWEVIHASETDNGTSIVVDMISQRWLTEAEVDRPEWQHWVTFAVPSEVTSDVGFLFIGGGRNGREAPTAVSDRMAQIAAATGSVVAELGMVPNQPLIFHGDAVQRVEDDLIGYTWDHFLETGDARWLARNPMVKSAVRAMDTMTAVMAERDVAVERFVVGGGSKRGWTTWLTGAMDHRVVGIVPIVIDVLNVDESMRHHFGAYGFWAVAVGNYVDHRIMQRMSHPRLPELYALVDPFAYRHRLEMPKLILNAAGDQFFLPDSSKFYWHDLRGENYLRYVPNADHSLQGTDAMESVAAFHTLLANGRKPPQLSWNRAPDGALQVMSREEPMEVLLWQMHNPEARDFRVETRGRDYERRVVERDGDGLYRAKVDTPKRGWTAYFLEFTYDVGAAFPLKLTTDVSITPDTLPFADKALDLPTSVTMICTAGSAEHARDVSNAVAVELADAQFASAGVATHVANERLYVNWEPSGNLYIGGAMMRNYLTQKECGDFDYQLESGPDITLPPAQ